MHNNGGGLGLFPDQEGGTVSVALGVQESNIQSLIRLDRNVGLQTALKRLRQLMQTSFLSHRFGRWYLWGNRFTPVQSFPKRS